MRIDRLLKSMVLTIKQEAKDVEAAGNEDLAKLFHAHAKRSQSRSHCNAVKDLMKSEIVINQECLDADDFLLGVKNGVVDLKSGKLIAASRDQYIVKQANVDFDPSADCSRWLKFLDEIMCGDAEMVEYLQRMAGYILSGSNREQVMFFLYGYGANGKSTFINIIEQLMGDYPATLRSEALMLSKNGNGSGATPDIANLTGKRLAIANELEEGSVMSEVLVKSMTGGDRISCRHLYGKPFSFLPKFKLVMIGNHKPILRGTDDGIKRRIRFIEFAASFMGKGRDKRLEEKLLAELPGILNWAIEGCLKWQEQGLEPPELVTRKTADYLYEQDILQHWLDDRCDVAATTIDDTEYLEDLFGSYSDWARSSREWDMRKRQFSQKLEEKGFKKNRGKRGIIFRSIKLKKAIMTPTGGFRYE